MPAVKQVIRPGPHPDGVGEGDEEGDEDQRRKEGREALSSFVAMAAEVSRRPTPVHGVQKASPLKSKFWASGGDSDESEEDEPKVHSPSTLEFVKEALDAGFTIDQLATAEQVLDTGKASLPRDLLLPRAIVESLIKRKLVGEPWQGPLPAPRVSPPRTLGDFLAKASHRDLGTRGGSGKSPRHPRSPTRTVPARSQEDSNFFEKTKIQDRDTLFHPLPRSTLWTEAAVACAWIGAEGGTVRAFSGCAERVQIGSGKFFRPTKGLCALFRRTGTRRSPIITKPPPAAYTTPSRPSFADVVRAGKQMAA